MVQFGVFFVSFWVYYLIGLKLKFLEVVEGFLRVKINVYGHFVSYIFSYYKHKHEK